MKKSLKTIQVFSMFVLSLSLIFSCKKEKQYSESLMLIPTTSSFVACFDLKAMVEKGEVSKMKENQVFKDFIQEFSDNPTLKSVIENPEKSGVDFDRMFLFMHSPKKIGISFDLKKASSFEKTVNLAIKESGESVEIKNENGISYISDELNAQSTIVLWDKNKCLISMESKEDAMKIFTTKEENSIVKNPDFAKFYQGKKDIAMWINYDKLTQDMEDTSWGLHMAYKQAFASKIKGLYSHMNLEFNKGNITIVTKTTPDEKAKELYLKYFNKEVDPSLLASTPEKTLILLAASIKLADYLKDFDLMAQVPAEAQDLLTSFKGDFLASVSDFSPEGIPSFTASVTVNDMKAHDALLNLMPFTKEESQGYTKVNINGLHCFISQKDNRLMLTSDSMVMASFISGIPLTKNLTSSPFKKDLQLPAYCYMNLDLDAYPATMKGILAFIPSAQREVIMMLKDFRASTDEDEATSSLVINFKKSDKNSLAYLLEAVQK